MKIAHVLPRFGPGGGIVQIVRETSERLVAQGNEVEIFTGAVRSPALGTVEAPGPQGLTVHRFAAGPTQRVHFPLMVGLEEALRQSRPDVIHAHNHRYGYVLQAARVARRTRTPYVVSTYYHPAQRAEPRAKKAAIRLLDSAFGLFAYERASSLITLTAYEAGIVRRFAPSPPIRVVPPGIDGEAWTDPSSDLPDPRLSPTYFLYAGRLARTKGITYLIRAISRLPEDVRRPLVLVGPDMGARPELEAEAGALGLSETVRFLGHVADDRTYRAVVRRATALVLPSEWESFGIVLLEAMAARTPVVGSRVGAIPEVLEGGRAGRLVRFGDVEGLAAALTAVVRDEQATRDQVDAGVARARSLDWSTATSGLRAVYEDAVRA